MKSDNKLDIVQGVNLLPWEWSNLGAVFGSSKENSQCVAARCNFVVRKGFDEVDQTQYGNVVEGLGDVGFNLRAKQYAFHVSASNLSYKQGEQWTPLDMQRRTERQLVACVCCCIITAVTIIVFQPH